MASRVNSPSFERLVGVEKDWLVPAIAMTLALACFVITFAPPDASFAATFAILPIWLLAGAVVYFGALFAQTLTLMRSGHRSPLRALNLSARPIVVGGYALAGMNMVLFMCAKPILNLLIPFRADPVLAQFDALMFFGSSPGQLLSFLNTERLAVFYHRGWFVLMVAALAYVLLRPASREKSALLTTYFALWTIAGPVVHALFPAGGPIFYERLTGEPFPLSTVDTTRQLSDLLWTYHSTASFGPGAGISAMPSLHIATMAWICLVFRRTRFAVPIAAAGLLIFALSMSLGWHYFSDGVVGAALCWAIFKTVSFRQPSEEAVRPVKVPLT